LTKLAYTDDVNDMNMIAKTIESALLLLLTSIITIDNHKEWRRIVSL